MLKKLSKKLLFLLLLSPVFSALSEPLITCERESFFSTYFPSILGYIVLTICLLASLNIIIDDNLKLRFTRWRRFIFLLALLSLIILFVNLTITTIHLTPDNISTVNESELFSHPDVVRGKHFDSDCVLISKGSDLVELSCKPDARTESVSLAEYNQALNALETAHEHLRDLKEKVRSNNLCTSK